MRVLGWGLLGVGGYFLWKKLRTGGVVVGQIWRDYDGNKTKILEVDESGVLIEDPESGSMLVDWESWKEGVAVGMLERVA